jgi:hypothetical protein
MKSVGLFSFQFEEDNLSTIEARRVISVTSTCLCIIKQYRLEANHNIHGDGVKYSDISDKFYVYQIDYKLLKNDSSNNDNIV